MITKTLTLMGFMLCVFTARADWDATFVNTGTNPVVVAVGEGSSPGPCVANVCVLTTYGQTSYILSGDSENGDSIYITYGPLGTCTKIYGKTIGSVPHAPPYGTTVHFGTIDVNAAGAPTNCAYTGSVHNSANYDSVCYVTTSDGQHFLLAIFANATVSFNWVDPACGGGAFTYQWLLEGSGYPPLTGPTVPQAGGGVTPAGSGGLLNLGDLQAGVGVGSGSPVVPNDVQPPIVGYTNDPTAANTNGPITFGTNSAGNPTNAASNGTVQQGDNALLTAMTKGDQAIVDAIHQADANNQAGHAGTSNGLLTANGYLAGLSNILSNVSSNFENATNGMQGNFGAFQTGMASNIPALVNGTGGFLSNAVGSMTNYTLGSPGGNEREIVFGVDPGETGGVQNSWNLVLSLDAVQAITSLSPYRGAIAWVIWVVTLYNMLKHSETMVFRILNQRQLQGSQQALWGANISWFTCLVYAAVIASLIASIPVALTAYMATAQGTIASLATNLQNASSVIEWSWVTAVVPVDVIISAFFSYVTYRFIVCDFLMSFIAAAIMMLAS
jgi:hypothetical protein